MDRARYLECLAADERRLRDLASGDLAAPVPSCPDWTLADLGEHVALVYLHKAVSMRDGRPREWPPADREPAPVPLLDRAYRELAAEFAARPDAEPSWTWYEPDQTVGFWVRRMAQETVIHRIDAELAAGVPSPEVPADLAIDGIDELLVAFLAYAVDSSPEDFAGRLPATERLLLVGTDRRDWLVRLGPTAVTVTAADPGVAIGAGSPAPDASVRGTPDELLRWLWRRAGDELVRIDGDATAIRDFRLALEAATQ
ncbi:maleylpyruvate isomerase family mycothiol-dependent enzyme [Plantactinospora siamensis]|uniref:Maleylpyruvate isomerase family mycothiol-dependent enzyme n=1 Tax=Plantactinospora siamensis TaxID=555372 RepID=A0ABV6NWG4_9ACTN